MRPVDLHTLILIACAGASVTAVIFLVIGHPQRRAAPELLWWAGGFALKGLGLALVLERGRVPLVISLPIANLLIVAATQFVLIGLERFAGQSRLGAHAGFLGLAALALGVSHAWSYLAVSITISVLITVVMVRSIAVVLGLRRAGLTGERGLLGTMFAIETTLLVLRGVAVATGRTNASGLTPDTGTVIMYFTLIIAPLLIGPALLALISRREQLEKERVIGELVTTLDEVRTLRGLLPICAACKQIRDDAGAWVSVEAYVSHHSHAQFTHSICPGCEARLYPDGV